MIPITKPFLPPLNDYMELLKGVWDRNIFTNNGPLVKKLEEQLKGELGLNQLLFVSSGTMAIQLALKALKISGEVITTPFSFVATTSSIVWEGCTPIFVDIDENSLNIDPTKIEAAITPKTQAILATHCFGNPCNIDAIDKIAKKHQLKVIYDAAHCFGTKYKGNSIFGYGDISITSFHATKMYHTVEGGALFTNDRNIYEVLSHMRNFGYAGPERFEGIGINGKNSELHAAMGLVNLKYINEILEQRRILSQNYDSLLAKLKLYKQIITKDTFYNFSYYPMIFKNETLALAVFKSLNKKNIFPRRYFFPSLNTLEYTNSSPMPISESISNRILCLPMYHDLTKPEQKQIAECILEIYK